MKEGRVNSGIHVGVQVLNIVFLKVCFNFIRDYERLKVKKDYEDSVKGYLRRLMERGINLLFTE